MNTAVSPSQAQPRANSFVTTGKVIFPIVVFAIIVFLGGSRVRVYAQQDGSADRALLADQGTPGIKGYVVGSTDVAAYTCPDVDTAKCPIKLTLKPGTIVLIVDNVLGSNLPGTHDKAWRKILYQGLVLYVPMRYISVNPPGSQASAGTGPDISLVQTSYENDGTIAPNYPNGSPTTNTISSTSTSTSFSTAPGSMAIVSNCGPNVPCRPPCNGGLVPSGNWCCPQGLTYNGTNCSGTVTTTVTTTVTVVKAGDPVTWYTATDGRVDGAAGDRIAIYCRQSGRIEVWSINGSQGHFLVSFSHSAVDVAGRAGFNVQLGAQGVVTIGGDGHGQYWAALHGGPSNATGQGDFAKIFHCYAP